jgi:hypothetical protein
MSQMCLHMPGGGDGVPEPTGLKHLEVLRVARS